VLPASIYRSVKALYVILVSRYLLSDWPFALEKVYVALNRLHDHLSLWHGVS